MKMGVHIARRWYRCVKTSPGETLVAAVLLMSGCATPNMQAPSQANVWPSRSVTLRMPDGTPASLTLDAQGEGSVLQLGRQRVNLPTSAEHVVGFGPVTDALARTLSAQGPHSLELIGSRRDAVFLPDTLELSDAAVALHDDAPRTELYSPLLREMAAQTFGSEERASIEVNKEAGQLVLRCAPGAQVAGVSLSGPLAGIMPLAGGGLRMHARGAGQFEVGVSDRVRLDEQSPLSLAPLRLQEDWQRIERPLPVNGWDVTQWQSVSLACPREGGELEIDDLQLILADVLPGRPQRALWVWDPLAWQSHSTELIAHLQSVAAKDVFLTVPLLDEACPAQHCDLAQPDALRAFIAQARQAGLEVWAVVGDPAAVYDEERAAWVARAQAFAAFNAASDYTQRLAGIQFDIEHYLVPGFGMRPADWNRRYLALFADFRRAAPGMRLDAVVPWWFGQGHASPPEVLEELARYIDRLTVMDYRTDTQQLLAAARPFMLWGQRTHRSVRLALESGPLSELELHRYDAHGSGELLLVALGKSLVYVLFDHQVAVDGGRLYQQRSAHRIPSSRTTFHDRPDALWGAVSILESQFSASQTFAGVAVHGLDTRWY